jgi:hypothetical protein
MSRRRSVSNPEGMDKWGTKRLRLVLPVSIIEEEIAEANAAIMIARREKSAAAATTTDKSLMFSSSTRNNAKGRTNDNDTSRSRDLEEDDEDENLDHDQLLRRARSRLLEDLSHSSIASGDKGILTLPHSLEKYKEVRTFLSFYQFACIINFCCCWIDRKMSICLFSPHNCIIAQ